MSTDQIIQQVKQALKAQYPSEKLLLLQYLQAISQANNGISPENIEFLSKLCQVSVGEIQTVIDFYSFLETQTAPAYRIYVSDNIIDQMQGSRQLLIRLQHAFDCQVDENSAKNLVRVSLTSCIGMSDQGPAILINGQTIASLTNEKIEQVISLVRQRQPIEQWPEALFHVSDNIQLAERILKPHPADQQLQTLSKLTPEQIIQSITDAQLRGRGGAGFPTGKKWHMCAQTPADIRYVVCNADEGEPGTFKDRVLLQRQADDLVLGMTICAKAINASQGFIYLRGEYRYLLPHLQDTLQRRRKKGLLGNSIGNVNGFDFDIDIHLGAGAYICGEESALLESLEGKAGIPRNRPPFPVQQGYLNKPSVVNNVETFINTVKIISQTSDWFKETGTKSTTGNKVLSISGDCEKPGIYEVPFGITIQHLLDLCDAKDTAFVQIGGAAGRTLSPAQFNHCLCYADISSAGSVMIFDSRRDLFETGQNFYDFFAHESCGFCTPCRVGTSLQRDLFKRIHLNKGDSLTLQQLNEISKLLQTASHCGLGKTAAGFINDVQQNFNASLQKKLVKAHFPDVALESQT